MVQPSSTVLLRTDHDGRPPSALVSGMTRGGMG